MPRFERTEDDVADNRKSNISPWLFYRHFNSMLEPLRQTADTISSEV